jgi:hypothetical protein
MTLALSELETGPRAAFFGREWYFPQRPWFLTSNAFELFDTELRRYVSGEVRGRAFLIAAHRGVGKTSLVLRALDQLERDLIEAAANQEILSSAGEMPQRPLLVKLNGSALVAPEAGKANDGPETAADAREQLTLAFHDALVRFGTQLPPSPVRAAEPPDEKKKQHVSAEAALQQITIALYRALAREVSACFVRHAQAQAGKRHAQAQAGKRSPVRRQRELLEIAAQLTLDLDVAPDLIGLRRAWDRLGRLETGVLWPSNFGDRLANAGRRNLGFNEIIAVATANQAFQVCSGRVETSQSAKGSAQREAKVEAQGKVDFKDALNKLWALTAGILVGGGVAATSSAAEGAAAGLATGLVSALAFGWSATRSHSTNRTTEYTFIADRTVQTLDRDLPAVIERVRAAGLTPIFLLDELDKLDDPAEAIATIVHRLKNLTTDYGFFCFLADREYYDQIEGKLRDLAYPPEHTYFSERLLVIYRPAELSHYLASLWSEMPGRTADPKLLSQAPWVLACSIVHRAQLNLIDVRREVARLAGAGGRLLPELERVCSTPEFLLPAAMQLALEHVLRDTEIRSRVESDNPFAQLAFEILYRIARAWYDEQKYVVLMKGAIEQELISRRGLKPDEGGTTALQKLNRAVKDDDIQILFQKVNRLAEILHDFAALAQAIHAEPDFAGLDQPSLPGSDPRSRLERSKIRALLPSLSAMPGKSPGLLDRREETGPTGEPEVHFYFLFDSFGVERTSDSLEGQLADVQAALAFLTGFEEALGEFDATLEQLSAAGVLPSSINPVVLRRSLHRLASIIDPLLLASLQSDVTVVRGIPSSILAFGRGVIGIVALLTVMLNRRSSVETSKRLAAVERMLGAAALSAALSGTSGTGAPRSPDSPVVTHMLAAPAFAGTAALRKVDWVGLITNEAERLLLSLPFAEDASGLWQKRVVTWIGRRSPASGQPPPTIDPPVVLSDLIAAASPAIIPAILRPDLDAVSVTDWSTLCAYAFSEPDQSLRWAFPAGLRALGFGRSVLAAADELSGSGLSFAEGAPDDAPFVIVRYGDPPKLAGPPSRSGPPIFAAPKSGSDTHMAVVEWLGQRGPPATAEIVEE